jgi:hypothetical protein
VAKNLGGDSLQRWLVENGFQVDRQASQRGFRIFSVRKPGDARTEAKHNL